MPAGLRLRLKSSQVHRHGDEQLGGDNAHFPRIRVRPSVDLVSVAVGEKHFLQILGGLLVYQQQASSYLTSVFCPLRDLRCSIRRDFPIIYLIPPAALASGAVLVWLLMLRHGMPPDRAAVLHLLFWALAVLLAAASVGFLAWAIRTKTKPTIDLHDLDEGHRLRIGDDSAAQPEFKLLVDALTQNHASKHVTAKLQTLKIEHDWAFLRPVQTSLLVTIYVLTLSAAVTTAIALFTDSRAIEIAATVSVLGIAIIVGCYFFLGYRAKHRDRGHLYESLLEPLLKGDYGHVVHLIEKTDRDSDDADLARLAVHASVLDSDFESAHAWAQYHDNLVHATGSAPAQALVRAIEAWYQGWNANEYDLQTWRTFTEN